MASARGQRIANMYNAGVLEANKTQTTDLLQNSANQSLSALGQGSDAARRSLTSYGAQAYDDISRGSADASMQLNDGRNRANSYLDAARGYFDPYQQQGLAAQNMYSNALGLNGADGNAQAHSAFQTTPGYEFQLGEATRAGMRQAAATGRLDGGGTLAALTTLGSGLANQEYGNYLNRLQGQGQMGFNAAQAIGGNLGQAANLQYQQGQGQAQIAQNRGQALAGINSGLGSSLANSFTGQGAGEAQVYGNLGNSLAGLNQYTTGQLVNGMTGVGQAQDAAKTANQNMTMSIIGQGIKLLAGPLTGGLSSLGGMSSAAGGAGGSMATGNLY
jgi:hypothetical protein